MTTKLEAVKIAADHIAASGFLVESHSNLSEAMYFRLPGRIGNLRVAAHACRHPFEVVTTLTFEYREAWQKDEQDICLSHEEIIEMADEAMETYRAEAESEDEEEAA